ncbi:MAG: GreA/GreB family elongation factor, partial [bacterium]
LRKLLLEDEPFQRFLLRNGEETAVSALVQCARGLSVLNSGETQSLLVRIVRLFPDAKPLVEKRDRKRVAKTMPKITSFRSYELYRKELEDIINVRIPENSRAIAHARSYGDLRENAEYKAAKEEQAYLNARRNELEEGLNDIQATDFTQVEPQGRVVPGSTVELSYTDGTRKTYHVMGLWDSDPNAGILSYDTPLGRLLLGTAVGDEVTTPTDETVNVESVKPLSDEMLQWALGKD